MQYDELKLGLESILALQTALLVIEDAKNYIPDKVKQFRLARFAIKNALANGTPQGQQWSICFDCTPPGGPTVELYLTAGLQPDDPRWLCFIETPVEYEKRTGHELLLWQGKYSEGASDERPENHLQGEGQGQ